MQRIDGPTRSATLPPARPVGAGNSSPGYFQDGDPLTGTPPTTLDRDWANMVQEEIVAPILAAGIQLDKSNHGQLLAALQVLFVPAGGSVGPGGVVAGTNEVSIPLPGGFVLKAGTMTGSYNEQSVSHSFDVPFPSKCWAVVATSINASGGSTRDVWAQRQSRSAAGFTLFLQWSGGGGTQSSSDGFDYIAIGN